MDRDNNIEARQAKDWLDQIQLDSALVIVGDKLVRYDIWAREQDNVNT